VADEFNARHPERNLITHNAMGKLEKKFKETGSVVDKPRVGRPSVGEDIRTGVIANTSQSSACFAFCLPSFCMRVVATSSTFGDNI
jgi:hypothetical protein